MKKIVFYTELSYLFGLISLAFGATMLVKANFGVSVVVAPAYLLHLKLSQIWSFVTFGVAEYFIQSFLLILLILLVRRFHWSYLFSFATALCYGTILDFIMLLLSMVSVDYFALRLLVFTIGLFFCAVGVSLFFHTYLSPEVYELLVKELSLKYRWKIGQVKTIYDCSSCLVALLLSFCFFGLFHLKGIGIGTLISAILNGQLIALVNRFLDSHFIFRSAFPSFERYIAPPPFPKDSLMDQ
jgi:uncharacterized membrane protein YczE